MPFNGTLISVDSEPIFVNLGNRLGAYVVEQGETPYIVLHEKLRDDNQDDPNQPQAGAVYQALVDFHNSLPDIYRLFPLVKFYEDLPQPQPRPQPEAIEPELLLIGVFRVRQPASRSYTWQRAPEQDYRLIG